MRQHNRDLFVDFFCPFTGDQTGSITQTDLSGLSSHAGEIVFISKQV